MAAPTADLLQIFFRFVEQTVQTHRSIMMRGHAKRSEAETYVEAGFPHRPVAFVIVGTQFEFPLLFALCTYCRRCGTANLQSVDRGCSGAIRVLHDVIVSLPSMKEKIGRDFFVKSGFVLQRFLRWSLAKIVVTRQAGVAGQMGIAVPILVILLKIGVGLFEPYWIRAP